MSSRSGKKYLKEPSVEPTTALCALGHCPVCLFDTYHGSRKFLVKVREDNKSNPLIITSHQCPYCEKFFQCTEVVKTNGNPTEDQINIIFGPVFKHMINCEKKMISLDVDQHEIPLGENYMNVFNEDGDVIEEYKNINEKFNEMDIEDDIMHLETCTRCNKYIL